MTYDDWLHRQGEESGNPDRRLSKHEFRNDQDEIEEYDYEDDDI